MSTFSTCMIRMYDSYIATVVAAARRRRRLQQQQQSTSLSQQQRRRRGRRRQSSNGSGNSSSDSTLYCFQDDNDDAANAAGHTPEPDDPQLRGLEFQTAVGFRRIHNARMMVAFHAVIKEQYNTIKNDDDDDSS
jgi:hypothetical protein